MDRQQTQPRTRPPGLGVWIMVGVAAVAIVLAGVVYGMVRPTADVQDPAPDASPEEVVATYLQAMQVRDRDTMRELLVDDEQLPSWADLVMGRTLEVTDVSVGEHREWEMYQGSMAQGWEQAVSVPVEFRVTQSAGGFVAGEETPWAYLLVRDGDSEPWRIADQGLG